ncbi:MAG: Fe-S cluster assembly protein SufD [Xanthomonadales bacterium]|jgi:Fe-S cluster assembly protein SufD|nr:Fe-S cluster assembly protein SufD [Xanthomonadales bacterium]
MNHATNPETGTDRGQGATIAVPAWLQDLSSRAGERFESHGWPHKRLEDWKYTPLTGLAALDHAEAEAGAGADLNDIRSLDLGGAPALGWSPDRSPEVRGTLPDGVRILGLEAALDAMGNRLKPLLEGLDTDAPSLAMSALNTARLGSSPSSAAVVIVVESGVDAGTLAVEWTRFGASNALDNARVIVLLGEDASLDLVEHHAGAGMLNMVNQFELHRGSRLRHARLQDQQASSWLITRTELFQGQDSEFEQASLDIGKGLARHDLRTRLAATGARCVTLGAYLPTGDAHVDHHLDVRHEAPGCNSEQVFRGVVHDRGTAVFNGRVHVLPGADDSEAHQSNQNLLLSREAEVNTKPELVIEADEVVASHGATVGQLDERAVFYLRSRGVSEPLARRMLTGAFCRSVVDAIGNETVREALRERLEAKLENAS